MFFTTYVNPSNEIRSLPLYPAELWARFGRSRNGPLQYNSILIMLKGMNRGKHRKEPTIENGLAIFQNIYMDRWVGQFVRRRGKDGSLNFLNRPFSLFGRV